jgi:hypothetical protein
MHSREARLADLERELKNYQSIEDTQTKTIRQMEERLAEQKQEIGEVVAQRSRAEIALNTLEMENRQMQTRCVDLEDRLK